MHRARCETEPLETRATCDEYDDDDNARICTSATALTFSCPPVQVPRAPAAVPPRFKPIALWLHGSDKTGARCARSYRRVCTVHNQFGNPRKRSYSISVVLSLVPCASIYTRKVYRHARQSKTYMLLRQRHAHDNYLHNTRPTIYCIHIV